MLELIAERRIEEAVANGELDNLPGAGKPAGYAPAEVRNPKLLQLRIESRYYGKVVRKLVR